MRTFFVYLTNVYSFVLFVIISLVAVPISILLRRKNNPWVIGGHRGRLYDDNSGALHDYITSHTRQDIIWITSSSSVFDELTARKLRVLHRNRLAARLAILKAPVLIYSHGEDDLDLFLLLWRNILGTKIMLNHCMHHLKSSGCTLKSYISAPPIVKYLYRKFVFINFDFLLVSSERERQKFSRTLPHYATKMVLGGGAHLDYFFSNRHRPTNNRIIYFPTHRESKTGKQMLDAVKLQIQSNKKLIEYLRREGLKFVFCTHINTSPSTLEGLADCFEVKVDFKDIKEELTTCALLISDYSSLSLDYMVFDKLLVYFPFDLEDFTIRRNFHTPTPFLEKQPGPVAFNLTELIQIITTNQWRNKAAYAATRAFWDQELFPYQAPVYAEQSYQKIVELIGGG
ncbi:MAG: CDP-glycerol glycerophosphotransferase family protein [Bacteroidota bacterium]